MATHASVFRRTSNRTSSNRARRIALGSVTAAVVVGSLAACSSSGSSGPSSGGNGSAKTVTVTVMGEPPTSDPDNRKAFLAQVARFEKENPTIHVIPSDLAWDPQTFTARLAGGDVPNLLRVPFTEPPGLIQRHQVMDLTDLLKSLPEFSSYNPRLLAPNEDSSGRVYGISEPGSSYTLGLIYNRALFTQAGLNPDKPPTTWDELRADAKQIHDRTGAVGFAETTTQGSGGWHLTAEVYSRGGSMETLQGGKQVPSFDAQPAKDALNLLHQMRFVDNSMGKNQLLGKDDLDKKIAAGQLGMFIGGGDAIPSAVQLFGGKLQDIGWGAMPGSATLLGGAADMVTATSSQAQAAAAIKWATYEYIQTFYDPAAAAGWAKTQASVPKSLIGIPGVSAFGSTVADAVTAAVKPYVNVPVKNYQPYVTGQASQQLLAEPPVGAQNVYAALDPVMQAVLTQSNANINSLLATASSQVASQLESAQQ